MKTELINLSSTYTYIRCDSEFELLFTNGQTMPMWRGFYCFRTEQLQEYNTNGQLIIQSNDDNCHMWWFCTNTLIMSVTDINNEALNGIGQLVSGISEISYQNALANLNQLSYGDRTNNLLESIQNSFSIFLNAYVEANNVQDFGYITGTINNDFTCNVFIAKANKFNFNCGISFSRNFNTNNLVKYQPNGSEHSHYLGFSNSVLFNVVTDYNPGSGPKFYFTISLKKSVVDFELYNNLNEIQSGYGISNISSSSKLIVPSGVYCSTNIYGGIYHYGFDGLTLNNPISVTGSSDFSLSMTTVSQILNSSSSSGNKSSLSIPNIQIQEQLSINFDVSKT